MENVVQNLIQLFILAFFVGKMEGNIEGPHPWAKKLPTKRYRHWVLDKFLEGKDVTGYHIWLFSTLFLIFHYQFLLGTAWSIKAELMTLSAFILFAVVEDFFAIVFNPYFGIKKFSPKYIDWHANWVGSVPMLYIQGLALSAFLFISEFLF